MEHQAGTAGEEQRLRRLIALFLLLCLILSGCAAKPAEVTERIFAMDTVMDLTAFGPAAEQAISAAEAEIYRLEALWSIGFEGSEISRLNREGSAVVSEETAALISDALALYGETGGLFNIAVYPVVDAWGFYSGDHRVPGGEELQALLPLTDPALVTVRDGTVTLSADGMAIDLGGIAKGYASAAAADAVRKAGASSAILSLGGNVYAVGKKPDGTAWKVGVQDPKDTASLVGILSLEDEAAVTSGAYQRYFEAGGVRYHHIIDPETGRPSDSGLASVTVVTPDAVRADAYSTALFIMGKDRALEFWRAGSGFDLVLVEESGNVTVTEGLRDRFSPYTAFEVAER